MLVAALTREPRTFEIQDGLAAQATGQLAVSDWVLTEFSAALSEKLRTRRLAPAERAEVLAVFAELVERSFDVLSVSRLELRTAARFADQYQTRACVPAMPCTWPSPATTAHESEHWTTGSRLPPKRWVSVPRCCERPICSVIAKHGFLFRHRKARSAVAIHDETTRCATRGDR